jgi:hypothetical protein
MADEWCQTPSRFPAQCESFVCARLALHIRLRQLGRRYSRRPPYGFTFAANHPAVTAEDQELGGVPGLAGFVGLAGFAGFCGLVGVFGLAGFAGFVGSVGVIGTPGVAGFTGEPGEVAPPGFPEKPCRVPRR